MLQLRPYQADTLQKLREGFAAGKRAQILYSPTGGGKTEMAIALLDATRKKNNRAAMLLDRIILCDQTSQRLSKYNIDHGVLQSGHWRYRPHEQIQVCSAQTIEKRGSFPGLKLLIVDECFPAGTLISTPSGPKPIHLVRCGDLVHNAVGVGQVVQTMVRPATGLIKLEFDDGTVIECTNDHPILTAAGWKRAESLEIGEGTFSKQGMRLLWQTIFSKHQRDQWKKSGDVARGSLERANSLFNILREEAGESDEQGGSEAQGQGKASRNSAQADKRGGNGQLLPLPQLALLHALGEGWESEYPVATKMRHLKTGYPTCYKLDLACPEKKIGIELDGGSHCSLERQVQDLKKTEFFISQGWSIYRVSNERALNLYSTFTSTDTLLTLLKGS